MVYAIFIRMKEKQVEKGMDDSLLASAIHSCGPVAKGSVSQVHMKCTTKGCTVCKEGKGHPAWIFAYRAGGKRKCLYVRKKDVPMVKSAIERGRRIETLLLEEGVRLIESLRAQGNAD